MSLPVKQFRPWRGREFHSSRRAFGGHRNNTAFETASGGNIFSYGDKDVNGNTVDNFGILTTILTH
jgi:hypothetical protein